MVYETSKLLASQSYEHWVSQELFSTEWFFMVGLLVVVYAVWFKIVDKRRIRHLLLLGCLSAVGFGIADLLLENFFGFVEYRIGLFPLKPALFIASYTITPILYMTVAQLTTSWKSYLVWSGVGTAVLAFGILPIYLSLGILEYHNFNVFYAFILEITDGIIARAIVLWLQSIEEGQSASSRVAQSSLCLQPAAAKPLNDDKGDKTDNGQ